MVDTDFGVDSDDAWAAAFGVKHPGLDVIGFTTVYEQIGLKDRGLRELLKYCTNKRVPIHGGVDYQNYPMHRISEVPKVVLEHIKEEEDKGIIHCRGILDEEYIKEHQRSPSLGYFAPLFMADKIHKYAPRKISLICIGPLSNIAYLIENMPKAAKQLERIYIMGGISQVGRDTFGKTGFNLRADIKATKTVLESGLPITLMPGSVTKTVKFEDSLVEVVREQGGKLGEMLADHTLSWRILQDKGRTYTYPHDPLTVGMVACPELYKTKPVKIEIDEMYMSCFEHDGSNIECCYEVDGDEFMKQLIFTVLS